MKTIKVIDLLNMIANGEEVPKKIMFNYAIGELIKEADGIDYKMTWTDMQCNDHIYWLFDKVGYNDKLKNEVEIIEEEKEIEKLDVALLGQCDNWLRCPTNKVTKQDVELNPYIIENIRENTLYFQRKINELTEAVNEIRKEK